MYIKRKREKGLQGRRDSMRKSTLVKTSKTIYKDLLGYNKWLELGNSRH